MNQVKVRTSLAKCNFFPGEFTIPEKSDTLSAGQWLGGRQKVGKHPQTGSDQTRGFLLHRIKHDYRQTTKSLVKHGQRSMHVPMSGSLYSKPSFVCLFIHLFSFLQHINSFFNLFFLHSPASRAKMTTVNTISKIRGQQKVILYPQPEGTLGEYMIKHGRDLGDDNCFGELLCLYNCTLLKKNPTLFIYLFIIYYILVFIIESMMWRRECVCYSQSLKFSHFTLWLRDVAKVSCTWNDQCIWPAIYQSGRKSLAKILCSDRHWRKITTNYSQTLIGRQSYTGCNCTIMCTTSLCKCRNYELWSNLKCYKSSSCNKLW